MDDDEVALKWKKVGDRWIAQCIEGDDNEGWYEVRDLAVLWQSNYWSRTYHIELKPTIGDDYPAVLRQMRANGSNVLLVGNYTGTGATREQFVGTFTTAAIDVVFVADVLK